MEIERETLPLTKILAEEDKSGSTEEVALQLQQNDAQLRGAEVENDGEETVVGFVTHIDGFEILTRGSNTY